MQHLPAQTLQRDLLSNLRVQSQHPLNGRVSHGVRLVLKACLRRFEVHLPPLVYSTGREVHSAMIIGIVLLARNHLVGILQKGALDATIRHVLEATEAEQCISS